MSQPDPSPDPPDSNSASRLRTATWFGGLAIAGLTAGIVMGRVTGTGAGAPQTLRPSQAQVLATGTPTAVVTTTATPSPTPSPTTTKPRPKPTPTKPPDYSPIPADATTEKGLDFGFLTAVQKNGDLMTISFDRADFYTGQDAVRQNDGKKPDNDYLIKNIGTKVRTFSVQTKAPILGVNRLLSSTGGPIKQQPMDADAFVTNATRALASGRGIPIWVRHTGDQIGPVTSLAEQYIP